MEKYLIYQEEDGTLKRRPIKDMEAAKKIAAIKAPIKLEGVNVHIVGIGTDADFRVHQQITNQTVGDHYKKLKANAAYYKKNGVWPK
jgi:hypothetical protein